MKVADSEMGDQQGIVQGDLKSLWTAAVGNERTAERSERRSSHDRS